MTATRDILTGLIFPRAKQLLAAALALLLWASLPAQAQEESASTQPETPQTETPPPETPAQTTEAAVNPDALPPSPEPEQAAPTQETAAAAATTAPQALEGVPEVIPAEGLPAKPAPPELPQSSPLQQQPGQFPALPQEIPRQLPHIPPQQPQRPPLFGQLEQSVQMPTPPTLPPQYQAPAWTGQVNQNQWQGAMRQPGFAPQPPLPGYINRNQMPQQPLPGGLSQNPRLSPPAIPGRVNDRPNYLPAYAYTNDQMVAPYHNRDIWSWDKRAMPSYAQWMRLAPSVTKFWRGYVPDPCMVWSVPIASAPGHFTFSSRYPGGPRGWLEHMTTKSWDGYPMYRYWFDPR